MAVELLLKKTELTGHDVLELAPGRLGALWGEESRYLPEEALAWLMPCLRAGLPEVAPYGITVVYEQGWNRVCAAWQAAPVCGRAAAFAELDAHVRQLLRRYGALTIYGV